MVRCLFNSSRNLGNDFLKINKVGKMKKTTRKIAMAFSFFLMIQPVMYADSLAAEITSLELELVKMETKVGDYADMPEAKLEAKKAKTKKELEKKRAKAKKQIKKSGKKIGNDAKKAGKDIGNAFKDIFD